MHLLMFGNDRLKRQSSATKNSLNVWAATVAMAAQLSSSFDVVSIMRV